MKTKKFILATFLLILIGPMNILSSQTNFKDVVDRYFNKRDQFQSLRAEVHFASKLFSKDDTMHTKAVIEMVSNPNDTIFGGFVFIDTEDKAYAYNGKTAFFGDRISSTLTINELNENPGRAFIHDWAREFIEASFLTKNQSGRAAVFNSEFNPSLADTTIGQWPCIGIKLTLPDQEEFTDFKLFVAYDTIDYMLRHRSISMIFQENEQFQSWTYINPEYGRQEDLTMLNDKFLNTFKQQETYESLTLELSEYPIALVDYSSLNGKYMGTNEVFNIESLDARLIVLDFWYSACYPCIKSIPEVNKLYDLFHDKGVAIYGVNIIDDEVANKSRMERYVRNNPMSYPTIMADRELYSHWVPDGYPNLIILDSNFKLIARHLGYSESMAEDLAHIIEEHLNR